MQQNTNNHEKKVHTKCLQFKRGELLCFGEIVCTSCEMVCERSERLSMEIFPQIYTINTNVILVQANAIMIARVYVCVRNTVKCVYSKCGRLHIHTSAP